ncbi:MAG: benzylsuccinate synthase subunit alpha [Deltaproteobacteria bacterium CG1_02_45_11]|nr:MAG: benzylsuccinate synthase subunit alpha [Deltaproteobacteria bacterium CG1_02_45_11]
MGIERGRLLTESYKATRGEPEIIRRAKALDHILKNYPIFINDGEFVVGDAAETPDTLCIYPEMGFFPTIDIVEDPDLMDDDIRDEAREIAEWWKPLGLQDKCMAYYDQHEIDIATPWTIVDVPPFIANYMSVVPPYMSVFEDGLSGRIRWCEENINKAFEKLRAYPWNGEENLPLLDKIDVWRAMIIADKGVIKWARRYSRLAKIIAENFDLSDSVMGAEHRKNELLEMSDICRRVPAEPATGFKDAMQSKWFVYVICHSLERYSSGYAHLEDRLMWPYYKASVIDRSFQPMTREEAIELVECERLKVCERGVAKGRAHREGQPGANDLHIITLGGLDKNGKDATNDLTNVILEASLKIKTPEPSLAFRYSPKINEKTRRLVFENIAQGFGFPSIKHEEKNTRQMIEYYKVPPDEAADWALVLCMAPGVNKRRGLQKTRTEGGGLIWIDKCCELAFHDGFDYSFAKIQTGPRTGDATKFKNFEELFEAFAKQVEFATALHYRNRDVTRRAERQYCEAPFVASLDDACVEQGVGAFSEKNYPNPWSNTPGEQAAADSLAAVKKLVFDEKKYTMEEVVKALRANFEGYEEMRRDMLAAPKWGNDDPYVDELGRQIFTMVADKLLQQTTYSGMHPLGNPQTVSTFATRAPRIGALPFGKKHGEVLHDGGSSPYVGMDKKGPTAVLKSVSRIPHDRYKGVQFNQRLPVSLMRSDKGFEIWTSYMKAWHDLNIDHVQFNVVETKDMLEAQKEPEKWEPLIVRIAGYSARFVSLPKNAQDAIISRTEQQIG